MIYSFSNDDAGVKVGYETDIVYLQRDYIINSVRLFKTIFFTDIKTGEKFHHSFVEEEEVYLAYPNHRSGNHCIRSITVEKMKEEANVFYVCRHQVLIDRDLEAFQKETLVL